MSYSDSFPSSSPVFQSNFAANGGRIDPRMTFTRADTPPTYAAPSAVHYWSNEKHLSSENLVLQSENYDINPWLRNYDLTPTGSQTAPDGSSNAWLLTPTAGTTPIRIQQAITLEANTAYTASCYMKAGAATHGFMSVRGTSSHYAQVTVDFSDPTNPTSSGVSFTSVSATSTAVGSTGWYKVVLNFTSASVVTSARIHISPTDGTGPGASGVVTWTSAGNETMYLWGVQLNTTGATVYDSPTTTQISRSYASSLKSVATAGQPRFEYSTDGQSVAKGLIIESQFTQLAQYTEDLSNAYWAKINTTVQSNAAIAPDGTLTADLVVETTAANVGHHVRTNSITGVSSSTTYTATVFAKAAGLGFCRLYTNIGAANTGAVFNLSDGTHNVTDGSGTFSSSSVGNGWYRLQMTFTTSNTNNGSVYFHTATDSSTVIYTGNGYGSVLIWGANLTQSSHSYSYLKAEGSATTKAAESLSVATSSFGLTGGPVSYVAEVGAAKGYFPAVLSTTYGSNSFNEVAIQKLNASAGESTEYSYVGGDGSATTHSFSISGSGDSTVVAVASDTNRFAGAADGGSVNTDTAGALPQGIDTLYVGSFKNSYGHINTNVKRIAVYNEALSDANLVSLTS